MNAMAELSRMAEMYHLENKLYQYSGGLGKVIELMGKSRRGKFLKKNEDLFSTGQEEWNKIVLFLERELKHTQNVVVDIKSREPICTAKANSEKSEEGSEDHGFEKTSNVFSCDEMWAICKICGKNDHKTYVSPFSGHRKASYLACEKFLRMSPLDRGKVLDNKGLCRQCLCPGAKKGHQYFCSKNYICTHSSHDSSEGHHVLVCDKHKDTPENAQLLEKFKEEHIQKFAKDLPS